MRLLEERIASGRRGAAAAHLIASHADSYLLSTQLGGFLSALLLGGVVVEFLHQEVFTPGVTLGAALDVSAKMAVLLVLLLVTLGTAQIAKAIAFAHPETLLCTAAVPLRLWATVTRPIVFLLGGAVARILGFFRVEAPAEREFGVSADEISEIVELSSEAGEIEEDEKEMIQGVITMSDTVVREIMTPRTDIVSVTPEMALADVVAVFVREGLSRVLVVGDDLDDVKGVLIAKDLMPLVGKVDLTFNLRSLVRPVYFVLNNKKIDELLAEFKREAVHFAVVLDEHGGVDGVVTVEDLLEEIVGDIFDEHDSPAEEADVVKTKSGDLLVDGATPIEDLNDRHGLSFPTGEYDTVAGFVIHQLGRIPAVGEILECAGGVRVRVEETAQNRVLKIRVMQRKTAKTNNKETDQTTLTKVVGGLPDKSGEAQPTMRILAPR
jgi:putative hemolysin